MRDPFAEGPETDEEPELEAVEAQVVDAPPAPLPALSVQPAQADLIRWETEVQLMVKRAQAITIIQDDATNQKAAEYALGCKKLFKKIDALEEHYKRPHLDFTAAVRSFAATFKDPLLRIEKTMGRLQADYRRIQENEKRKRQAALDKEQRDLDAKLKAEAEDAETKGETYTPVVMPAPVAEPVAKVTRTAEGSASQKRVIRIEVVDLNKVDKKYIIRTLDEKAVKDDFRAGNRDFPGLMVIEDYDTRYRT